MNVRMAYLPTLSLAGHAIIINNSLIRLRNANTPAGVLLLIHSSINMGLVMKVTVNNIINLWFGDDTPIRQYKIKMNPLLWVTCQRVSQNFVPASGAEQAEQYRKSDKMAFARTVQRELLAKQRVAEDVY